MAEPSSRVSTLELFFDLVFVFTITQVALIVERDPSWSALAQAFLELTVIYWMYGGFAWLTNALGSATSRQRIVLLAGMAAFFVVSLAVPRAFADDGVAFGVAYLALNAVHLGGFLLRGSASFAAMLRIGATNVTAAALVLVAGSTHGSAHWPLWIGAVAIQLLPPLLTRTTGAFAIDVDHFAERHGLMIIIVLGESLVSVALAAQELTVDAALIVGTLCGLAASAAMWWSYFGGDDEEAADAMRRRAPEERGALALLGYDQSHLLMIAGVTAVAAGSRLSLPVLTSSTSVAAACLVGGGVSLFLLGSALFRAMLGFAAALPRVLGAAVAPATIPVGIRVGAAQQLLVLAVLISALLVLERGARLRGTVGRAQPDRAG